MKVIRMSLSNGSIARLQKSGFAWISRKKKDVVGRLALNERVKVCDTYFTLASIEDNLRAYCIARIDRFDFVQGSCGDIMVRLVLMEVLIPVQLNRDVEPIEYGIQL